MLAGGSSVAGGCDRRTVGAHVLDHLVQLVDSLVEGLEGVGVKLLSFLVGAWGHGLLGVGGIGCPGLLFLGRLLAASGLVIFFFIGALSLSVFFSVALALCRAGLLEAATAAG